MSRYYARDIKKAVIDYLSSNTTGINVVLQQIDTERSETYYTKTRIRYISSEAFAKQTPEIFVSCLGSGTEKEVLSTLADEIDDTYTLNVFVEFSDNTTNIDDMMDNYEEALKRCLHGVNITGLTYIFYESFQKLRPADGQDATSMALEMKFTVRVN